MYDTVVLYFMIWHMCNWNPRKRWEQDRRNIWKVKYLKHFQTDLIKKSTDPSQKHQPQVGQTQR